jgi:hypothetical protein
LKTPGSARQDVNTDEGRSPDDEAIPSGGTMQDSAAGEIEATIADVKRRGTTVGIWMHQDAAEHRAFAGRVKGMTAEATRDRADHLDDQADMLLNPATYTAEPVTVGAGGEVMTGTIESRPFVDTLLASPDMVAVDASRHRLGLAAEAGGVALALDAAETAQAKNSLEKMLAHQTAAAHTAALQLQAEALVLLGEFKNRGRRETIFIAAAVRLIGASARMMGATQLGISTLYRLRTAGRQTLVVQHVHVSEGGQAVVAGQVKGRRRRRTTPGG